MTEVKTSYLADASYEQLSEVVEAIGSCAAVFEVTTSDVLILAANADFLKMVVMQKDRRPLVPGDMLVNYLPNHVFAGFVHAIKNCRINNSGLEAEFSFDARDKISQWRCIFSPIMAGAQKNDRIFLTGIDITEKTVLARSLDQSRESLEQLFGNTYDSIVVCDADQIIKRMNTAAERLFGYEPDEAVGMPVTALLPERFRERHPSYVRSFKSSSILARTMNERSEVVGLSKDGREFSAEISISKTLGGTQVELTAIIRDVSEKLSLIERLRVESITDHLTGAYNRRHLYTMGARAISMCTRYDIPLCLIMLDIDGFKKINDNFGHAVGDQVLQVIGKILHKGLRDTDTCSRVGGEEFAILLEQTDLARAITLAERLRSEMESNIEIKGVDFSASFGVSAWSKDMTLEQLLNEADTMLYKAKSGGRNRVEFE